LPRSTVAAQNPDDPGVLILSPFGGAAYALDNAVITNPYDPDAVAEIGENPSRLNIQGSVNNNRRSAQFHEWSYLSMLSPLFNDALLSSMMPSSLQ
jgi:hypothetical protein